MIYRLWDTDISRLFGTFANEPEALAFVQTLVEAYGDDYAEDLALGCERDDGSSAEPLTGAALVARADAVSRARADTDARHGVAVAARSR